MHPSSRQSTRWLLAWLGVTALAGSGLLAGPGDTPGAEASGLPYVYTDWVHYTTREGLPNDHIFSVAAASTEVWVGTEDGLAVIDKQTGKVKRTWKMEDGLPWKVVSGIAVNEKTGEVWLALFGGGLRSLAPAQQRPGQRRRLRRGAGGRQRLVRDDCRGQPVQHRDRRMDDLQ